MLLIPGLCACSSEKQRAIADRASTTFHAQLDAEQYQETFAKTDELFREKMSESDWTALLKAVHQKLGKLQRSDQVGYKVMFSNTGTIVGLTYNTEFAGGKAVEDFTWCIKGEDSTLVGYFINAPTLITK